MLQFKLFLESSDDIRQLVASMKANPHDHYIKDIVADWLEDRGLVKELPYLREVKPLYRLQDIKTWVPAYFGEPQAPTNSRWKDFASPMFFQGAHQHIASFRDLGARPLQPITQADAHNTILAFTNRFESEEMNGQEVFRRSFMRAVDLPPLVAYILYASVF